MQNRLFVTVAALALVVVGFAVGRASNPHSSPNSELTAEDIRAIVREELAHPSPLTPTLSAHQEGNRPTSERTGPTPGPSDPRADAERATSIRQLMNSPEFDEAMARSIQKANRLLEITRLKERLLGEIRDQLKVYDEEARLFEGKDEDAYRFNLRRKQYYERFLADVEPLAFQDREGLLKAAAGRGGVGFVLNSHGDDWENSGDFVALDTDR